MSVIICPKCELELRAKKNGVPVESMADFGSYQLYMADLLYCPSCGLEIIAGLSPKPLAEHHQPSYAETVLRWRPVARYWASYSEKLRYQNGVRLVIAEEPTA